MGDRKIVIKKDIVNALQQLGVKNGQNIIVHTSMKSFGFVCGGPQIIIEALIELVGKDGTIIMPTQTWKNMDPAYGVHWEEPIEWWDIIRDNWPAYDKDITPTNTMGAVAEMFRKWSGVLRSDHPVRSFAAWGKNAQYLINNHDLSDIFGESSPIGKLYDLDGYVLLLGTGYDKNTSIHLADERADYPSKHMEKNSCAMMKDGERKWVTYSTLYVDGEEFIDIGIDFEKKYRVGNTKIGNADVRFIRQREIVDFAVEWIEKNRK
ncbi:aminoglycoside N(3)-acetyltransferase [Clostridium beijerinckii]|jgi:Aminoglycoside N3''-acetyltransferase|uniref:Aminoglycoside N(3)-acetyltransferase n=2 Tax=Clostridium beijerinckii TaxID=1520 RepID=A0AAE2V0T7_CLOBE|nr:AAC(3) family N-acetyltransferase [Clostridium beijerinckii]ABR36946.1 Aminoglycoside N(3')-acetyltransferase [Clostridium beijerinckii NCIMB 8052]AIU01791.1 aminoglycoside N(3')-acetyltransferase [Clostridium beijerinckii ATCC 35702]MBF7808407.1 AAC(3) family N-acetyltransferase [Clostridium beijerinckii]NRT21976.1 aminoglycoside 3-N-acetyltransferase [Clostridium beijerinckii]NRT65517.1 aminoglycoside 3-N-acetyltransferase [Clostridium beijerinckii]